MGSGSGMGSGTGDSVGGMTGGAGRGVEVDSGFWILMKLRSMSWDCWIGGSGRSMVILPPLQSTRKESRREKGDESPDQGLATP